MIAKELLKLNQTYIMIFDKIALYVVTAILSSLFLGSLLAVGGSLFSINNGAFISTVVWVGLFTVPVFFVVAVPLSLILDYSATTKYMSSVKKLAVYVLIGAIVGVIFWANLWIGPATNISEYIWPAVYGILGSAIFFGILEILKRRKSAY